MTAWWRPDAARLDAFLRCVGAAPGGCLPASFTPVAWQAFPAGTAPETAWLAGLDVRLARPVAAGERLLCRLDRLGVRALPGGALQDYRLTGADGSGGEAFSCRIELWVGAAGTGIGPQGAEPAATGGMPQWTGVAEPATIAAYAAATGDAGPWHERFAHGTWIGAVLEQHLLRFAGRDARTLRLRLRLLSPLAVGSLLCWRPRPAGGAGNCTETAALAVDGEGRRIARARCWIG